jgi:hypothetical protein
VLLIFLLADVVLPQSFIVRQSAADFLDFVRWSTANVSLSDEMLPMLLPPEVKYYICSPKRWIPADVFL